MPRVPLPSVSPQVQQPVQFSAPAVTPMRDATGAQIQEFGAAQQAIGGGMLAVGERLKNHFDIAQAKRGDNAAEEVIRSKLTGFLQKFGPDAGPDARKQLFDEIEEGVRNIESGLQSPEQKTMFRASVDERLHNAAMKADEHFARQVFAFELSESMVRAERFAIEAGNTDINSPKFAVAKANAVQEVETIANRRGFPQGSEQRDELRRNTTTAIHSTAITNLLKTEDALDIDRAKDHLEAAAKAGEIAPKALPELRDDIKRARTKWEVKSNVNAVFEYALRPADQEGAGASTIAEQQDAAYVGLAKAAEQYQWDEATRHAASTALGRKFDVLKESEAAQNKELWTAVENTLLDPENRGMDYGDLPGPVQRALEKAGLKDRALALARGDARSDQAALRRSNRLGDDELRKMSQADVDAMFPLLSVFARQDLQDRWAAANGTAKPDVAASALDLQLLETYAKKPEFGGIENPKDDEERWKALRYQVQVAWTREQAKTHEEKRAVLDRMLIDQATLDRSFLRGDVRRAYETLSDEELKDTYFKTTEGLVHGKEVTQDPLMWAALRNAVEMTNRNNAAAKSQAMLPTTHEGLVQFWVSMGRPASVKALQAAINGPGASAAPAPAIPPDVQSALVQRVAMRNLMSGASTTGAGTATTPEAIMQEWKRIGSPRTTEALDAALKKWPLPVKDWWGK